MRPHPPDGESAPVPNRKRLETLNHILQCGGAVILQPVTMRIPNSTGVYSPSQLRPVKEISYQEFLTRYADHPIGIWVCFDETPSSSTILERSVLTTAYGIGLDCWYIVEAHYGCRVTLTE